MKRMRKILLTFFVFALVFSAGTQTFATGDTDLNPEVVTVEPEENSEETEQSEETELKVPPLLPGEKEETETEIKETPSVQALATEGPLQVELKTFVVQGQDIEAGSSAEVVSGTTVSTGVYYVTYGNYDANSYTFRVKVPKGVILYRTPNVDYTYSVGSATDLHGTNTDPKFDYYWITRSTAVTGGSTLLPFQFHTKPFENGVTPHGTQETMTVEVYDLREGSVVTTGDQKTLTMTAKVSEFRNTAPTTSTVPNVSTSLSKETVEMRKFTFNASITGRGAEVNGLSFTKSVTVETLVTVPAAANGKSLLKFKEQNIVDQNGIPMRRDQISNVSYDVDGNIKQFTIKQTFENDKMESLGNVNLSFGVEGSVVDPDQLIQEFNLTAGSSTELLVEAEIISATATPWVAIENTGTDPVSLITNNVKYNDVRIRFVNSEEVDDLSITQNLPNTLIAVNKTNTTNMNTNYIGAFAYDTLTYQIGSQFVNLQKEPMTTMVMTQTFDPTQQTPLMIETGVIRGNGNAPVEATSTMGLKVSIVDENGVPTVLGTFSGADLNTSQKLVIPAAAAITGMSLVFEYTNFESMARLYTAPKTTFTAVDLGMDQHGTRVENEATLSYEYKGETYSKLVPSVSGYNFLDWQLRDQDAYESNKQGTNLNGNRFPQINDVNLFTLHVKNQLATDMTIERIVDTYASNMNLYDGTTIINGNPTSTPIAEQYLSDLEANINIKINGVIDNTYFGTLTEGVDDSFELTFSRPIVLEEDDELEISYTMYMNDTQTPKGVIKNDFEAFDATDKVAEGSYRRYYPVPTVTPTTKNLKEFANVTNGFTNDAPYGNDVGVYTITVVNSTTQDWGTSAITITDTMTQNVRILTDDTLLTQDVMDKYHFDTTLPIVLGYDPAALPEDFDPSEITITNSDDHSFVLDLGTNKLLRGESIDFHIPVRIATTVHANDTIRNDFVVEHDNKQVSIGFHSMTVNVNQDKDGFVSLIKSSTGVDGSQTQNLLAGDRVLYTVELANFMQREGRVVNVETVMDRQPTELFVDADTLELKGIFTDYIGSTPQVTERTLEKDTDYTVTFPEPDLMVVKLLNQNTELPGGEANPNRPNSVPNYKIVMSYESEVTLDTTLPNTNNFKDNKDNTVAAFYTQPVDKLVARNGKLIDKANLGTENIPIPEDGNPLTNAVIYAINRVQVVNQKQVFGNLKIACVGNPSCTYLLDGDTPVETRPYQFTITNLGFMDFDISHMVMLVPDHENIVPGTPITITDHFNGGAGTSASYETVYTVMKVTIDDKEWERIMITGYMDEGVETPIHVMADKSGMGSTVWTVDFETEVNVPEVQHMMFVDDINMTESEVMAAIYTDEELLISPNGSATTNGARFDDDDKPETDFDSDPTTATRYHIESKVRQYVQSPLPYLGLTGQFITSDGITTTYRDYKTSDLLNPGDEIGWKIVYGNERSSINYTLPITKGSKLVAYLPPGLEFASYETGGLPAGLVESDEFVQKTSDGGSILTWVLEEDLDPLSRDNQFIIHTSTDSAAIAVYDVTAYFEPIELSEFGFAPSRIKASGKYNQKINGIRTYNYFTEYGKMPMSNDITHFIYAQNFIRVSGTVGLNDVLEAYEIADPTNTASTIGSNRNLVLSDVKNDVRYKMFFNVEQPLHAVTNVSLITTLPSPNDKTLLKKNRNTDGKARLVASPDFKVYKQLMDGTYVEDLDPSDYVIEFTDVDVSGGIPEEHWTSTTDGYWTSEADWLADGKTYPEVTAMRVRIRDDYDFERETSLVAEYTARLEDYRSELTKVYSTFISTFSLFGDSEVVMETNMLSVSAKINDAQAHVSLVVKDPTTAPLIDTVEMTIEGKDEFGVVQYTQDITLSVDELLQWYGSEGWFYNLPEDLTYDVKLKTYDGYTEPQLTIQKKVDVFGTKTWDIVVTYERIPYSDVTIDVTFEGVVTAPVSRLNFKRTATKDNKTQVADMPLTVQGTTGSTSAERLDATYEYAVEPIQIKGFTLKTLKTESVSETLGTHTTYEFVYTKIIDETIDPEESVDPEGTVDPVIPPTGVSQDATTMIVGGLVIVFGLLLLATNRKKRKEGSKPKE